jgi:hypothetical protein
METVLILCNDDNPNLNTKTFLRIEYWDRSPVLITEYLERYPEARKFFTVPGTFSSLYRTKKLWMSTLVFFCDDSVDYSDEMLTSILAHSKENNFYFAGEKLVSFTIKVDDLKKAREAEDWGELVKEIESVCKINKIRINK